MSTLPEALRDPIARGGQELRARQGQVIFHETDPSDAFYLLLEGRVRLFVSKSDGSGEHTTGLLRAPAVFGDRDLLLGRDALETAICLTPARLCAFEPDLFRGLWKEDPELHAWLAEDIALRYAHSLELTTLQLSPLVQLIAALVDGAALEGLPPPTSAELAAMTGGAAKTITRALAQIEKDPSVLGQRPTPLFHACARG